MANYRVKSYLTDNGDAEEADGVHVKSDGDAVEGHGRVRHGASTASWHASSASALKVGRTFSEIHATSVSCVDFVDTGDQ